MPITLPTFVPNSRLYLHAFVKSEGDLPDGCGTVQSALLVENTGKYEISFLQLEIEAKDAKLTYSATRLPPGGKVLLYEDNRIPYIKRDAILSLNAYIQEEKEAYVCSEDVEIRPVDADSFCIINHTDSTFESLCVYFRTYYSQWQMYDGSVAKSYEVTDLRPGEVRIVKPMNYLGEYSKILGCVRN